ncbi:hypothetical protein [Brevibacillus marinus]|uniref:hypothetical protein n=1 Tax=Brevibacillus marinus TaxID=2496837 RepID=UPI000F8426B2|nr:hypothetical protein [Brevibacillus marinus]
MPRLKSKLTIEERLNNLSQKNREYYKKFIDYLVLEKKSEGTITQYSNVVINFLETFLDRDVTNILFSEINDFLKRFKNPNNYNKNVYAISSFYNFLSNKNTLSFDLSQLKNLTFRKEDVRKEATRLPNPLTIKQIVQLRELLRLTGDYKKTYSFEMVYTYGLELGELEQCTEQNYDISTRTFTLDSKKITVNETIHNLITRHPNLLKVVSANAHQYRFQEMGKLIGREIKWQDINATRKRNFFVCPICQNDYENTPDHWVIVKYDNDDTKWIVCRSCGLSGDIK